MSYDYRAITRRWTDLVWNARRHDLLEEFMAPTCLVYVEGMDVPLTPDDYREYLDIFWTAVPDVFVHQLSVTVDGDKVYMKWRVTGTHLGPGLGIPPTGGALDFSGLTWLQYADGRIVGGQDHWNRGEVLAGLMEMSVQECSARTGLTRREAEVALLMAEHLTHKAIAARLKIKPNTARRHCEKVLAGSPNSGPFLS